MAYGDTFLKKIKKSKVAISTRTVDVNREHIQLAVELHLKSLRLINNNEEVAFVDDMDENNNYTITLKETKD